MLKKIKMYFESLLRKWNDPSQKLEKEYSKLLLEARNLQRNGDIPGFAKKMREAEDLRKQIDNIE